MYFILHGIRKLFITYTWRCYISESYYRVPTFPSVHRVPAKGSHSSSKLNRFVAVSLTNLTLCRKNTLQLAQHEKRTVRHNITIVSHKSQGRRRDGESGSCTCGHRGSTAVAAEGRYAWRPALFWGSTGRQMVECEAQLSPGSARLPAAASGWPTLAAQRTFYDSVAGRTLHAPPGPGPQ